MKRGISTVEIALVPIEVRPLHDLDGSNCVTECFWIKYHFGCRNMAVKARITGNHYCNFYTLSSGEGIYYSNDTLIYCLLGCHMGGESLDK